MPPKNKRKRQLDLNAENAREAKRRPVLGEGSTEIELRSETEAQSDLAGLVVMSEEALDTDEESVDPTFDLDSSMKSDVDHIVESFCEDWVSHLDRDDRVSLGVFLCFQLSKQLGLGETRAAELTGMMIGKSERAVREWRKDFLENDGEIPEGKQGRYQRSGVMWSSEDLNKKATRYIRENASVKGQPNLTIGKFCHWVNDDLLPNETLEPVFPERLESRLHENGCMS